MDFTIPQSLSEEIISFKKFIKDRMISELPGWYQRQEIPAEFFSELGAGGWLLNGTKAYVTNGFISDLAVETARKVTTWAADIFGAASVIREHPIHKFPMDAWASSLGEGTQDVQKLVIFRELMKQYN